jgi:4-hydroxy-3-polyprenylbenzoate decarboxylase
VLAVRESPLTDIHLENMLKLSRMGVVISPPMPAFYMRPGSIEELVDHTVARILDLFEIGTDATKPWSGVLGVGSSAAQGKKRGQKSAKARVQPSKKRAHAEKT